MEENIYRTLMKHLGEVGIGYPQIDDFLEVLKKTLTPEEAEVALGLPTRLAPMEIEEVEKIAHRAHKPADQVVPILENLAQKGLLYKDVTDSGKPGYAFIQIGFGLPQVFFWKGEITDQIREISRPLLKYLAKGRESVSGTEQTRLYRYVPVNKVVDHTLQAVLPYDMMTEVVKKAKRIAVVHCPCRVRARYLLGGSTCTHTLEACIKFNKMADFVLEKGLGREIFQDEALEIIRKSEEEGLIHFVDNCQDEIQHNCNCCSCCCWNVMPIKKRLVHRDCIMATYYLRRTDEDECIGCGQCAQDCPLEIITMENNLPVVDESVCIGCGVCLLHCPTAAAKLKRKDDKVPLKDFQVLHRTAIENSISSKKQIS